MCIVYTYTIHNTHIYHLYVFSNIYYATDHVNDVGCGSYCIIRRKYSFTKK